VQLTYVAMAGVDANEDDHPEFAAAAFAQVNVTDADSSGIAELVEARAIAGAYVDSDSNGIREKESLFAAHATIVNAIEDDHPEHVLVEAVAYEREDPNEDGVYEEQRAAGLRIAANDTNSNGYPEAVTAPA